MKLISRNENDLTKRFDEVAAAVAVLPCEECVIDGEVVALDEEGRSSFQLLQSREMEGQRDAPLLLRFRSSPAGRQKSGGASPNESQGNPAAALRRSGRPDSLLRRARRRCDALLDEVQRRGLEGIIGKQAHSLYEAGRRSGAWIKLKCVNEQEFVIGGYTPPAGARQHFGALLVGYYEKKKLLFAGKVGTGFNTKILAILHKKFQAEARDDCPFADLPSKQGGQWVQGITPGDDAKDQLDESRFYLSGEIRRMDARGEAAGSRYFSDCATTRIRRR